MSPTPELLMQLIEMLMRPSQPKFADMITGDIMSPAYKDAGAVYPNAPPVTNMPELRQEVTPRQDINVLAPDNAWDAETEARFKAYVLHGMFSGGKPPVIF